MRVEIFCAAVLAALPLTPALAQATDDLEGQLSSLDQDVDSSMTATSALALAQEREAVGDVTGASTILERYLLTDEESVPVRAKYAMLLCSLSDKQAGQYELLKLRATAADAVTLNAVESACGGPQ